MLTGVGGKAWREAAQEVACRGEVDLDVVSIGGPKCDAHDVYGRWRARDLGGRTVSVAQLEQVLRQVLALNDAPSVH